MLGLNLSELLISDIVPYNDNYIFSGLLALGALFLFMPLSVTTPNIGVDSLQVIGGGYYGKYSH